MRLFGHRGAAAIAPENTVASIKAAMAAGADGVECDVRRTADGVLVVCHDDDVSRTTGARGMISTMTLDEIRSLDAAAFFAGIRQGLESDHKVPLAEEVRSAASGRVIYEIKGTSWEANDGRMTADSLAGFLSGRDVAHVVVSSFDPAVLAVIRRNAPDVVTGLLAAPAFDPMSVIEAAVAGSHAVCFLNDAGVTPASIGAAHDAARLVIPWTVNDPSRLRELARWGADGVITDDPGAARAALQGSSG